MHDEGFHGWISFDCGSEMEDAIPAAHYTRALRRHTDIYHRVGSYGDSAVIKYFSYTLLVWLLFVGYSTAFATPARNKLRVSENLRSLRIQVSLPLSQFVGRIPRILP
jgi:hypothetical protein